MNEWGHKDTLPTLRFILLMNHLLHPNRRKGAGLLMILGDHPVDLLSVRL